MASSVAPADGIVELAELPLGSPYFSADMAPVSRAGRRWGMKDIAVLWISMSACIPTYMLASSLIEQGMNWWQAVLTIFLGNCIVLVPMVLNAHAGTRYGIPFPVYCRASFGIRGRNVPAMLRALVACGWFGIQTWIGGGAIFQSSAAASSRAGTTADTWRIGLAIPDQRRSSAAFCVLAAQYARHLLRDRIDPLLLEYQSAAPDSARAGTAWRGPTVQAGGFGDALAAARSLPPGSRRKASSGRFFSRH